MKATSPRARGLPLLGPLLSDGRVSPICFVLDVDSGAIRRPLRGHALRAAAHADPAAQRLRHRARTAATSSSPSILRRGQALRPLQPRGAGSAAPAASATLTARSIPLNHESAALLARTAGRIAFLARNMGRAPPHARTLALIDRERGGLQVVRTGAGTAAVNAPLRWVGRRQRLCVPPPRTTRGHLFRFAIESAKRGDRGRGRLRCTDSTSPATPSSSSPIHEHAAAGAAPPRPAASRARIDRFNDECSRR